MTTKELFEEIIQLPEKNLFNYIYKILERKGYKKIVKSAENDYLFAEGDIPIVLVAHVDTVFTSFPSEIYYDNQQQVIWSPDGLGADDRAGVTAILQIILDGYKPCVIFTNGEEKCVEGGEKLVTEYYACPFEQQIKYMIELDRMGSKDCVFYDCLNEEFKRYIQSYDFTENYGTYSDISVICNNWNIAGVNLSIGYYDEHTFLERLKFKEMYETIDKVKNMLNDADTAPQFSYEIFLFCERCHVLHSTYDLELITEKNGSRHFICWDCISQDTNAQYCDSCLNIYIADENDTQKLCPNCKERYKRINYGKRCNS